MANIQQHLHQDGISNTTYLEGSYWTKMQILCLVSPTWQSCDGWQSGQEKLAAQRELHTMLLPFRNNSASTHSVWNTIATELHLPNFGQMHQLNGPIAWVRKLAEAGSKQQNGIIGGVCSFFDGIYGRRETEGLLKSRKDRFHSWLHRSWKTLNSLLLQKIFNINTSLMILPNDLGCNF